MENPAVVCFSIELFIKVNGPYFPKLVLICLHILCWAIVPAIVSVLVCFNRTRVGTKTEIRTDSTLYHQIIRPGH